MTKPTVFNYKNHEELRQAYKELLADNQQLIADNRKLRQEVTELKQLNDGYVKIIAKNQETNNKLMASVQKQTGGDFISRADAIDAVVSWTVEDRPTEEMPTDLVDRIKALPSADAVPIHEDGTLEVKVPNATKVGTVLVMDTDSHIGVGLFYPDDAEQTDKLENQPCLVERNYTTEGGGGEIYHPNRQQGKWLPIEETIPTYDGGEKTWLTGMKCSNCGKLFDLRVGYYFCPSCGAYMGKKGGAK